MYVNIMQMSVDKFNIDKMFKINKIKKQKCTEFLILIRWSQQVGNFHEYKHLYVFYILNFLFHTNWAGRKKFCLDGEPFRKFSKWKLNLGDVLAVAVELWVAGVDWNWALRCCTSWDNAPQNRSRYEVRNKVLYLWINNIKL